jgi:hypothetical protein
MDSQAYQYETSVDLQSNTNTEDLNTTSSVPTATVQPPPVVEYWVFDNGICG